MGWTAVHVFSVGEEMTTTNMNALFGNITAAYPPGSFKYFYRTGIATETFWNGKWLECNGAAVLKATYPALDSVMSALGYPFGSDTTHFTLPDLRGRAPVAVSNTGGHTDVTTIGNNDGVALASRRQKHSHAFTDSGHVHPIPAATTADETLVGGVTHNHTSGEPSTISGEGQTGDGGGWGGYVQDQTSVSESAHTHAATPPTTNSSTTGLAPGTPGTLLDQPAFLVGGVWAIAFA